MVADAGIAVCNSTEAVVIVHIWLPPAFFFIIVPAVAQIDVSVVVLVPAVQLPAVTVLVEAFIDTPVAGILVSPLVTAPLAKRSICRPLCPSVSIQTKFARDEVATWAL